MASPVPTLDRLRATLTAPAPTDCDDCARSYLTRELADERAAKRLLHLSHGNGSIAPIDRTSCPYPKKDAYGSHSWVRIGSYYLEGARVDAYQCANVGPGQDGQTHRCGRRMTLSSDPSAGGAVVCPPV